MSDVDRPGRRNEGTNEEIVNKIHDIVLNDRRLKIHEITHTINISNELFINILREHLGMRKLTVRWVPPLLAFGQKRNRVTMFKRNPSEFLRRYITADETWIHYYTPEAKEQSRQWIVPGDSAPKKAKTVWSTGKVLATVFWDSRSIIFIDYTKKGKNITGQYHALLLYRLHVALIKKQPYVEKKKSFSIMKTHQLQQVNMEDVYSN